MKIGVIAPPWIPVPPPAYGGTEQIVALQARCLADAGHEVSLVAAPGSEVEGVRIVSPLARLPEQIGIHDEEWLHALAAAEALADADVVIDNTGPLGAILATRLGCPTLHVSHGPIEGRILDIYKGIARLSSTLRFVAISEAQRRSAPGLPFAGVCHNALDITDVPFRADDDGYLAFLGRMAAVKGAAEAIRIARGARLPLLIAAKCHEPAEWEYFERYVEPELDDDVRWLGEVGPAEKYELLAGARALLFPIDWPEPFGMVMIEAMACGTPVLATPRGAVPEVVVDGVTGFIRQEVSSLTETVARLGGLDREVCRSHVETRFSPSTLCRNYERSIARALRQITQPAWSRTPPRGSPIVKIAAADSRQSPNTASRVAVPGDDRQPTASATGS